MADVPSQAPSAQELRAPDPENGRFFVLPLSANCPNELLDVAKRWQNITDEDNIHDMISQQYLKAHSTHRVAVIANSLDGIKDSLKSFVDNQQTDSLVFGEAQQPKPNICFVFSGQGQQWYHMGRCLYKQEVVFRDTIDECDELFRQVSGWSLVEKTGVFDSRYEQSSDTSEDIVNDLEILHPVVLFFQIGFFHLLKHWGVYPDYVVGQSLGEFAAAYAADSISLKEAITIIYNRGKYQNTQSGKGIVITFKSDEKTAEAVARGYSDVHVAVVSSPLGTALAGDCDQIEDICRNYPDKVRRCRISAALHSPHMDPVEIPFRKSIDGIITSDTTKRSVPFYSSMTGNLYHGTFDMDYWWKSLRYKVRFQDGIESVLNDTDVSVFLEIAATGVMRSYTQEIIKLHNRDIKVVSCGLRYEDDHKYALIALGSLYAYGADINWRNVKVDSS